jgi:DNA polymerase I-like protein with 3'-5' exonuclease and polymerase domains
MLLLEYLVRDVKLTEQVALQQMQEATDEQFNLIVQMGDMLKVAEEMEANGMHVDTDMMIDSLAMVAIDQITMVKDMNDWLDQPDLLADKPEWYNSNHIMSAIMFGGDINYTKKVPDGIFKSGKRKGEVRYKNQKMVVVMDGITMSAMVSAEATKLKTKAGATVYKVDEEVLSRIKTNVVLHAGEEHLIDSVLNMRAANKVCNTYYRNLIEMADDETIHHTLNQTATATGRLSSSKPNLQNVPSHDSLTMNVKDHFTSRHEEGIIMEVDFNQLEICALAWLTKDPQLIHDITSGKDLHAEIGGAVGLDPTDKKTRTDIKRIVFAMIYGAGAKGIAKSSGLHLELVKDVMSEFYARYSTIKDFYEKRGEEIAARPRYDIITRDKDGNPCPMFEWDSPTGRKYLYSQDKHRPGPSYTQNRNYPVQGTATGDIVPVVLAEIGHVLRNEDCHAVMVNTTHDSVTFDCEDSVAADHLRVVLNAAVFDRVGEVINERIPTIEWDIPLTVTWEAGPSWGDMRELDKYGY